MPDEVLTRISGLSLKIQKLVSEHHSLKKELQKAKQENILLREKCAQLEESLRQINEQVFILKASAAPLNEEDRKIFLKSLNEYLRTVDKCISLLKS